MCIRDRLELWEHPPASLLTAWQGQLQGVSGGCLERSVPRLHQPSRARSRQGTGTVLIPQVHQGICKPHHCLIVPPPKAPPL
eukprot:4211113-Prorocentrum_lima.AAC.1